MKARYIVRFDDICPTMDWTVWNQIEPVLNKHGVKPILSVVPDNQDPELMMEPAHEDFWQKVRDWQKSGWTIALHGHQHLYTTKESGITKINNYSEFVGLSYEKQRNKLEQGLKIFAENGVRAEAWVAPAHSFDELTIKALLELGINVISDGYYFWPIKRLGATWIPQQLWRFRAMPPGIWTVCFHHNEFIEQKHVDEFVRNIEEFASVIISFDQALNDYPAKKFNLIDKLTEFSWHGLLHFKNKFS